MNLAVLSVCALALAVVVSCVSRLNVGVLAVALAWIVGVYVGGMPVDDGDGRLSQPALPHADRRDAALRARQCNGTLERIAHHAVRLCRGNAATIPIMFFVLGAALASMGPGNIATAALLAPMAMATAARTGIPLFLMAIMVGNGANSGALSPFAPTGIIVNGIMARNGLPGLELQTYLYNLLAHALVAFAGYALFGGLKLFASGRTPATAAAARSDRRTGGSDVADRRVRPPPLDHAGDDRRARRERHRREGQRRHGGVCRRGRARAVEVGRRWRGDQADAVAGDRDGVRRHRADRAGRAGAGHRPAGLAGRAGSRRRTP